LLQKL
jgi:RES domain